MSEPLSDAMAGIGTGRMLGLSSKPWHLESERTRRARASGFHALCASPSPISDIPDPLVSVANRDLAQTAMLSNPGPRPHKVSTGRWRVSGPLYRSPVVCQGSDARLESESEGGHASTTADNEGGSPHFLFVRVARRSACASTECVWVLRERGAQKGVHIVFEPCRVANARCAECLARRHRARV